MPNITIRNYITKEISPNFSLAVSKLSGKHSKTLNEKSDRAYFIIKGNGIVEVGTEKGSISEGDAVYIPHNTPHSIKGELTYVVINSPAFNPQNEKTLE